MRQLILLCLLFISISSCKMAARTALKYWSKKQVKEFVANCETHSTKIMGEEKAKTFCDCAVDQVATKYTNYEDVSKAGLIEVLKVAQSCK